MRDDQKQLCAHYGVQCVETRGDQRVGVAQNTKGGLRPLNGLRHLPGDDTAGWYIWAGEQPSTDPDFFVSLHAEHLAEWCPDVIKFLGLPPGWRFLKAGDHEDVWYDDSIAHIIG